MLCYVVEVDPYSKVYEKKEIVFFSFKSCKRAKPLVLLCCDFHRVSKGGNSRLYSILLNYSSFNIRTSSCNRKLSLEKRNWEENLNRCSLEIILGREG